MIHTEKMALRNFCESDLPGFRALIEDKMASEWAPYDAQWPLDEASLRNMLTRFSQLDHWYAMEYQGEIVGFVVAQPDADDKSRDIGYTVRRDMQRKGLAYEACAAVMRELARDEKLEKFTAGTAECNYPSIGLLQKLGFVPRAMHRAWFKKDENGQPMWFLGYSFECNAEVWRK